MSEYEVLGIEAMTLDAGSKQYSNTFVIPEVIRDGVKVLDLCGFSDVELDSEGPVIKSLLRRGLLKKVDGGFEILFKRWR